MSCSFQKGDIFGDVRRDMGLYVIFSADSFQMDIDTIPVVVTLLCQLPQKNYHFCAQYTDRGVSPIYSDTDILTTRPTPQNSVIVLKWREIDIDYLHHLIGVLAEV